MFKGDAPYNANGVLMEDQWLASYFRSVDVLTSELNIGNRWMDSNYPGHPSLMSILEPFRTATGTYKGLSFSCRPSLAQSDLGIESSWIHQVAEYKAMILANEHTLRVEPSPTTAWIGRQHATWNVLEVSEDTTVALMLYREWKWTTTREPPRSALPIEIAARNALELDEEEA